MKHIGPPPGLVRESLPLSFSLPLVIVMFALPLWAVLSDLAPLGPLAPFVRFAGWFLTANNVWSLIYVTLDNRRNKKIYAEMNRELAEIKEKP